MGRSQTFALHTLGCKLNYAEGSSIGQQLEQQGWMRVDFTQPSDCYIINTCSVTAQADKKCRNLVRQAKRNNAEAKVVVIGCYAQLKPEAIASIPGVNLVLGANAKFDVDAIMAVDADTNSVDVESIKEVNRFDPAFSQNDRTRTFLKVQDGCDYHCTFCTIPLARGRSRSTSIDKVLQTAQKAIESGAKEIVLTGVNIGDFGRSEDGRQRGSENFHDLIVALDDLEGVERFRISSIEPNLLTDEIIDFVASSKKFMPHFHIPLQTGVDRLLRAMRRKYDTALYRSRVEHIKAVMPNACIGVDVIVGFPGETDEDIQRTASFLQDLQVSYLHVFTYSERQNTRAPQLDDTVPVQKRRERNYILRNISDRLTKQFYREQENHTFPVLWEEGDAKDDWMYGYTSNYIRVRARREELNFGGISSVALNQFLEEEGVYSMDKPL
ncbi:MAG: tRNA (N(6)-L-threonylcarbamoyladenosine(37)-C(2))-methylthiotransferase MtaB [Bacteroidota bacterium]|nr:tRNA (N(6)-L-threonylcarbamoyladenosine(37)-C(2))-methylthiotransferase MtaB [Bacteroidota bacterium]